MIEMSYGAKELTEKAIAMIESFDYPELKSFIRNVRHGIKVLEGDLKVATERMEKMK